MIELCVIQKWLNNKLNAIVSKINLYENIFNSTDTNSKSRSNLKDDRFSSYEAIQVFKTESWKATTSPPPSSYEKKVVIAYFIMVLSSIHFTILSIKILQNTYLMHDYEILNTIIINNMNCKLSIIIIEIYDT